LIIGGDIIACKNKTLKSFVLYPRGTPFYTQLSGKVTATPGSNMLRTTADLTGEIRRGDAIRVPYHTSDAATAAAAAAAAGPGGTGSLAARFGTASTEGSWFRVATAEMGADRQVQNPSVTSDQESSLRAGGVAGHAQKKAKEYHDVFNEGLLPLDGDFDGEEASKGGKVLRHGCTNDVRQCWADTAADLKRLAGEDKALEAELKRLNLITKSGTTLVRSRTSQVRIRGSSHVSTPLFTLLLCVRKNDACPLSNRCTGNLSLFLFLFPGGQNEGTEKTRRGAVRLCAAKHAPSRHRVGPHHRLVERVKGGEVTTLR
jgi:hypothetical protein